MADYWTVMADYWLVIVDYWVIMGDSWWLGVITGWLRVITGWLRVVPVFSNYELQFRSCSATTAKVSATRLKPVDPNKKCLICGENHSHKGCPSRELRKPTCANCKGPHVVSYKGCPEYKKHAFKQHVVSNQKSYASVLSQNTLLLSKPTQTFTFTAEQLTKFVANVIIQIAQPQVCYPNPKQHALDLKSSMCRKVSQAAKTFLSLTSLQKICLNQSVLSALLPPRPPKPFTFSSTKKTLVHQNHLKTIHHSKIHLAT